MMGSLAMVLLCGCTAPSSSPRFSDVDPRITEVIIEFNCREGFLIDTVEYLNAEFVYKTGSTNSVVVSALTPQQEAESPPITLKRTAPLEQILSQVATQGLVRMEIRRGQVVLLPDLPARKVYAQEHAEQWANAASTLDAALEVLRKAPEVTLWDPEKREKSPAVTNLNHIAAIVNWIRAQPLAYDESDSKARAEGALCQCLPWRIEFGEPKQIISIHGHNLIVNKRTSFKPARYFDLHDFRKHVHRAGKVQQKQ